MILAKTNWAAHSSKLGFAAAVIFCALVAMPAGSANAFGADCDSLAPKANETAQQAILRIDAQWSLAYWSGDRTFLECLYDPAFFSINADGSVLTRSADIAGSKVGLQHASRKVLERLAFVSGNTAVVRWLVEREDATGRPQRLRGTDTYHFDGRRWRAVFAQDTWVS
jgi:hypothetical protein